MINMFSVIKFFIAILIFNVIGSLGQKIDVTVLYETICSDSLNFINKQLLPNWAEIAPYVNLHFVPFGKATSINGGEKFECQHGAPECKGNKIQSCALNGLQDANAQLDFVHCFMNTYPKGDVGKTCAATVGLNWAYVEQCYFSSMGRNLQLVAESITKKIRPKFVPTILFNQVFDQIDQDEALIDFKGVLCKHLNYLRPGTCI